MKEEKQFIFHCIMYKDVHIIINAKALHQDSFVFGSAADSWIWQCT